MSRAANPAPAARPVHESTDSRHVSRLLSEQGDPNRIIAAEIGPAYRDYRRRWDLAKTFRETPPFPLQVDFEPLFRCQLRCPICLFSLPPAEKAAYGDAETSLATETILEVIDHGASRGLAALGLNGMGEPLLWPELTPTISHARERGLVDVMFNTNGLLLTPDLSRRLIRSGLTRIMISLDAATPETYAAVRPGSDYARVVENIETFLALRREIGSRLPLVRLSYCVTSLNEHELADFIARWSPLVDFFSIQHFGNIFPEPGTRDYLFPRHYLHRPPADYRCGQPNKRVLIRHDGGVIPCCDASALGLIIGNIHEAPLAQIWNGPLARRVRDLQRTGRWAEEPICRRCRNKWGPAPGEETP